MNKVLGFLCVFSVLTFAQDPRAIIQEVQKRTRSSSQRYEGTLQVIDSKTEHDEYKVWLEARGRRVFEPTGQIRNNVLKAEQAAKLKSKDIQLSTEMASLQIRSK